MVKMVMVPGDGPGDVWREFRDDTRIRSFVICP